MTQTETRSCLKICFFLQLTGSQLKALNKPTLKSIEDIEKISSTNDIGYHIVQTYLNNYTKARRQAALHVVVCYEQQTQIYYTATRLDSTK